jgi:predicted HTH domain antitoxin
MTLNLNSLTLSIPEDLPADKRLRLAVALFDAQLLTNGQASEMAEMTRAEFLDALGRFDVTPFQYDDVEEALADAQAASL